MVKKIILVFKTHFDIGFTDLPSRVIDKYADSMLKEVIATCKATGHMGRRRYVWTMPAWPLKVIIDRCGPDLKKELDLLIERDQIVWHALPFTSHTDFCSAEECIEGLRFGRMLSETYGKPYPISAKMTDVPGHGIMLPAVLAGAGVRFLHLGCNEFANPPKLPFLFHWQATSGERVLTMYSKGGYGTSLLPPEDWPYPVWMALMQTKDNCGPQTAGMIEDYVKSIHEKYPHAEVVCGTMDEFYRDLAENDLSGIPVVKKDLADTWIHGVGAYPLEVGIVREERERGKRLQALVAKQALEGSGRTADMAMPVLDKYYENINLFGEHTWGADVKTWLGPDRVYKKKDFVKAKSGKKYQFMEKSWQEQKNWAYRGSLAMRELKILAESGDPGEIMLFNPNNSEFTGWVSLKDMNRDFSGRALEMNGNILPITKIEGDWACYVEKLQPFVSTTVRMADGLPAKRALTIHKEKDIVRVENHRYGMTFSEKTGLISELFDKKANAVLLKERNQKSVFSYQYDRYGIDSITTYLKNYAYRFSTWGIQDYGREGYPECKHKTYYPRFQSYSVCQDTVIFYFKGSESVEKYGDAKEIRLEVTLPPAGDELFVSLWLNNKQESPYIESGSFLLPFAEDGLDYRVNKSNAVLDPSSDIQENANHVFYCLENFISGTGEKNGLCVIAKDTPLVALGTTGIYTYLNNYVEPKEPVMYFNLFNNMWGTNFPQWIGGDFRYRFVLFGINKTDGNVFERAAQLREGVEVTHNRLDKEFGRLPEHMQLINARKEKDGIVLRFRDLSGEEAQRSLQVNGYCITPVNLYNIATGAGSREKYDFSVKPYGIYSFLLTKTLAAQS